MMRFFGLFIVVSMFSLPVYAVQPDEVLKDTKLEQRARAISAELRCLVCQNQSIDDSDAPLARDLRLLVRERLTAGDTDEKVMSFIVDRYGEFVLLRPPFAVHTFLLWASPLILLAFGMYLVYRVFSPARAGKISSESGLTDEEKSRLAKVMKDESS